MDKETNNTQIFLTVHQDTYLATWIEAFLIDRKAQNLTPGSVHYYWEKLKDFSVFCEHQALTRIDQVTPAFIRSYLLHLEETGHNPGGVHGHYRSLKAFLRWYENEAEPPGWKNPIRKVKGPKIPDEPIEPVSLIDVGKLLETCDLDTLTGQRDRAIMLFLLDTGVRVTECINVNLADVDLPSGQVLIRQGKGRKPRNAYLEKRPRRALRDYLKKRMDRNQALWITTEGERVKVDGIRSILRQHAKQAGIPAPSPHDFRRAFAINMLRNGVDLITLSRLLGHSSLAVLKRYLKQMDQDLREAHAKYSPVEHSDL